MRRVAVPRENRRHDYRKDVIGLKGERGDIVSWAAGARLFGGDGHAWRNENVAGRNIFGRKSRL